MSQRAESAWIKVSVDDAQRIYDALVGADSMCSGYMESDDVAALVRLAEALGIVPHIPAEFVAEYPHEFREGPRNTREVTYIKMVEVWPGRAEEVECHQHEPIGPPLCKLSRCRKPREAEIHR